MRNLIWANETFEYLRSRTGSIANVELDGTNTLADFSGGQSEGNEFGDGAWGTFSHEV